MRKSKNRSVFTARGVALGQGVFFLTSGLWPVVSIGTFEKVTGPKRDDWLVKTVGLLIATTGAALLTCGLKGRKVPEDLRRIAAGQAAVLGGVSLFYSLKGTLSKIYLLDTLVESSVVGAWAAASRKAG